MVVNDNLPSVGPASSMYAPVVVAMYRFDLASDASVRFALVRFAP